MTTSILQGNCLDVLRTLETGSVQTCVTSPPYYGLRDYGTAQWEGGDPNCDHAEKRGGTGESSYISTTNPGTQNYQYKGTCKKCGAHRIDEQIGLEETPELFVQKLVEVFREARRVLKDDGTLWLNLGDSYAGSGKGGQSEEKRSENWQPSYPKIGETARRAAVTNATRNTIGIKPKDLIGIPWMVAFALRADGWYLRSDIIWHKPNPMPESVTDRPTKSHEYIFLLSKSAKYYYDADAILEPVSPNTHMRVSQDVANQIGSFRANGGAKTNGTMKAVVRTPKQQPAGSGIKNNESFNNAVVLPVSERNKRSVWTVTTKPYREAHFATFPPDLVEPCILAGSRPGDTVLDPFNGSGTTGAVSIKHHRNYVGIELNPAYIELTNKRLSQVQPVLLGV